MTLEDRFKKRTVETVGIAGKKPPEIRKPEALLLAFARGALTCVTNK